MWLQKPADEVEPESYYRVELKPKEREVLLEALTKLFQGGIVKAVREKLELAERVPLPLTSPFDWSAAERLADRGYGLSDQIFDGFNPHRRRRDDEQLESD